jgi:predicted metal-dependent hydrolase
MKQLPDNHFIDIGDLRLPIKIKKLRTSRRLIVRYQPLQKSLSLTLPQAASVKQGLHFVNEKRGWILKQINEHSGTICFTSGTIIPVLGRNIELRHIGGRGLASEEDNILYVHGDIEFMPRRVKDWLMGRIKTEIMMLAQKYAEQLKVKIKAVSLRDTVSHWGSCSYDGNLSFSWRLIFAPYEVMDYVVAHEVAHIREHNHSPAFWKLVEQLQPEFKKYRAWLKSNGKSLYLYAAT